MEISIKVVNDLNKENFKRMKFLSILFILLGIFLIVTDYSSYNPWDKEKVRFYKILDISFTILSILVAAYYRIAQNSNSRLSNFVIKFTVSYIILWSVLVSGIGFSDIWFSTYITVLLLSVLYMNFKPSFFISMIWVSTFLILLIISFLNNSQTLFTSKSLELLPFSIIATLLSYSHFKEKSKLLEMFYENQMLNEKLNLSKENLKFIVERKTNSLIEANIELEESRSRIRLENDRFKSLIENLHQGVLYINSDGDILEANISFLKIIGLEASLDIKLKNIRNFAPLTELKFINKFNDCLDSILTIYGNGLAKSLAGNEIYIEYYLVPITEYDNLVGILVCLEDYTERKRIENELIIAKEKAEESNRLKTAFLANMSHEIRTPMNGILGFLSLLQDNDITKQEQEDYIEIINKSGERLLNTINDIIDISRIESNDTQLFIESVDICNLMLNLKEFFTNQCNSKGIELNMENELLFSNIIIQTDWIKLNSIFTNLIRNAIKFTNEGSITVGMIDKDDILEFYVKDTGIGIAKDRQKAIFDRFVQADIEDTLAIQGSGLGLAITKSYIEMLGGNISVESELGNGSTFFVTLPK